PRTPVPGQLPCAQPAPDTSGTNLRPCTLRSDRSSAAHASRSCRCKSSRKADSSTIGQEHLSTRKLRFLLRALLQIPTTALPIRLTACRVFVLLNEGFCFSQEARIFGGPGPRRLHHELLQVPEQPFSLFLLTQLEVSHCQKSHVRRLTA